MDIDRRYSETGYKLSKTIEKRFEAAKAELGDVSPEQQRTLALIEHVSQDITEAFAGFEAEVRKAFDPHRRS